MMRVEVNMVDGKSANITESVDQSRSIWEVGQSQSASIGPPLLA